MKNRTSSLALSLVALLAAPTTAIANDEAQPKGPAAEAAEAYIERIEQLDDQGPTIKAVLTYNVGAPALAEKAEDEGLTLGGRTVLVKDNIETYEWSTTAGSLALENNRTARDAPMIARLRAAGGVILGKTNLSEWANIRDRNSSSGWSAIGDLTRNPYALDRSACGSSSGSGAAIAAGFAWAAIGTETNGSITCPASVNGLVGFKPTVGMVSRTFVVPISATQDTAGPMTRNVYDAALLLSAIAGSDPSDPATAEADSLAVDFTDGLAEYSLEGVRIGVMRNQVGALPSVSGVFEQAIADLEAAGAVLVDVEYDWPEGFWQRSLHVLLYELQRDMNSYLATLPGEAMPKSLADIVAFNNENSDAELRWFGQSLFERALEPGEEADYRAALETNLRATREEGVDRLLAENNVAFLVAPTTEPAWSIDLVNGDHGGTGAGAGSLPAIAGYPHITVPMGHVEGLPVGFSIFAGKWQDHEVLRAGAAYERARTAQLPVPQFKPWLSSGK